MGSFVDLTGKTFNKLTVLRRVKTRRNNMIYYLVRCFCGVEKEMTGISVSGGYNKTCGCSRKSWMLKMNTTHGGSGSPLYKVWRGMQDRCSNRSTNKRRKNYAQRGVTIEWNGFDDFKTDMEKSFLEHISLNSSTTIDRKNNDGNYSKGNCRWVTLKENARNRTTTVWIPYDGTSISLAEYCEKVKSAKYQKIIMRLRRGWSVEDAIKN